MSELAQVLKSLRKVPPQVAAELEYSVDKNLLKNHPGLFDTGVAWYGGKMSNYLNEVTKNDSSQYAIAVMEPDELSNLLGRANMEDPAVRARVLDMYNRATLSSDGLKSIVKLDGLVNEKGFIDVTKVTPGSQETAEALRLLDRDRHPDVPAQKIPVLVQASGAKWATDPAPRLRYNGQTSGTLNMPRWEGRRPAPLTKTVADATSPSFYKDQPKTADAVNAKVNTFYDPAASLAHGEAVKTVQSTFSVDEYAMKIARVPKGGVPRHEVEEATTFMNIRRSRMKEYLDPLVEQYGADYVKSLAGKGNIFTMKLLGAKGAEADLPIVLTRTERFGTVPLKPGEFSIALSSPRETGMHAGEPISVKAFQGNNVYHDYLLGQQEIAKHPPGSAAHQEAQRAIDVFEERRTTFAQALDSVLPTKDRDKTKTMKLLFDAVNEAKEKWAATRKPGTRESMFITSESDAYIEAAIAKRLPAGTGTAQGTSVKTVAKILKDITGLADTRGSVTRPFILRNVKKPIFLVDVGDFHPDTVLRQLRDIPEFGDEATKILTRLPSLSDEDASKLVQRLIESRGYDSAIYLNTTAEGSNVSRYANPSLRNGGSKPTGYSPSFMIWKEDQIVPLDDASAFPKRGDNELKKALAILVAPGAAETTKEESGRSN